jgi:hypothetical protein
MTFDIYRFYQKYKGLCVDKNQLILSFNSKDEISNIVNSTIPINSDLNIVPKLNEIDARQIFINYLKPKGKIVYDNSELMIHVINFEAILCYKVNIIANQTLGDWEAYVDALNGKLLEVMDISNNVNGKCLIFHPDPISSTRGTYGSGGIVDGNDATNTNLDNARVEMDLLDITLSGGQYSLVGPKARIIDDESPFKGLFTQSSPNFFFNRSEDGFEAVMCYYYIDNNMRYIHDILGYPGIHPTDNLGVSFDPHGLSGADNSHYKPSTESIAFGEGGVDDGEDPAVIIHELGHAIHDFVTGGANNFSRAEGLSEGFGDYWAQSFTNSFRDYKDYEGHYNEVFRWDGPPWGSDRRTDVATAYKINTFGSNDYTGGSIFATVLTKINTDIGRLKTDRAVLKGMAFTIGSTIQPKAAEFIYQAAVDLGYSNFDLCIIWNHFNSTYNLPNEPVHFTKPAPPGSLDVYMKDDYFDFGDEVNNVSSDLYLSEDIWVRNSDDNQPVHQNPEYKANSSNFVYVKVRARGCNFLQNGVLHLYWSKASTGLKWPYSWTYSAGNPNSCTIMTSSGPRPCGGEITSGMLIPPLKTGEEVIIKFPWSPPNPAWYDDVNDHHYCLYARIVANDDPMFINETEAVWLNTKNNNNIAWKNVSIFDLDPNNFQYPDENISVFVNDVDNVSGPVTLTFKDSDKPHYSKVLDNGEVYLNLREPLRTIWVNGGSQSTGIVVTEDNRIKIISMPAQLKNINLTPNTNYVIDVQFEGNNIVKPFSFDLVQSNILTERIGGEQFLFPSNGANSLPRTEYQKIVQNDDYIVTPNPSDENFILWIKKPVANIQVSIYSLDGKEILNVRNNHMKKELDFIQLDWPNGTFPGIYLLKVNCENKTDIIKIVKY